MEEQKIVRRPNGQVLDSIFRDRQYTITDTKVVCPVIRIIWMEKGFRKFLEILDKMIEMAVRWAESLGYRVFKCHPGTEKGADAVFHNHLEQKVILEVVSGASFKGLFRKPRIRKTLIRLSKYQVCPPEVVGGVRKLQLRDLIGVKNLISDHVKPHRLLALLAHLAYGLPLKLIGLNTIVGSIAQTNNGNIVGVMIARRFSLGKVWTIGPVVVHKLYRRSAIGSNMMKLQLRSLKDIGGKLVMITLSHRERHLAARRFFASFGFYYVKRIFLYHDQARYYVRMAALTGSHKEKLCPEDISARTRYVVMLKEL